MGQKQSPNQRSRRNRQICNKKDLLKRLYKKLLRIKVVSQMRQLCPMKKPKKRLKNQVKADFRIRRHLAINKRSRYLKAITSVSS